jgi:hypothetical protein
MTIQELAKLSKGMRQAQKFLEQNLDAEIEKILNPKLETPDLFNEIF